jgi:transcriptional regulator with XRE-family HTH domain
MNINDKIKQLRLDKEGKPTQEDIANALGIPRPTYAKWELNVHPDYSDVKRIAEYYHVSVEWLLNDFATDRNADIPYVMLSQEDLILLKRIKMLSPQSRKMVETVVDNAERLEKGITE